MILNNPPAPFLPRPKGFFPLNGVFPDGRVLPRLGDNLPEPPLPNEQDLVNENDLEFGKMYRLRSRRNEPGFFHDVIGTYSSNQNNKLTFCFEGLLDVNEQIIVPPIWRDYVHKESRRCNPRNVAGFPVQEQGSTFDVIINGEYDFYNYPPNYRNMMNINAGGAYKKKKKSRKHKKRSKKTRKSA